MRILCYKAFRKGKEAFGNIKINMNLAVGGILEFDGWMEREVYFMYYGIFCFRVDREIIGMLLYLNIRYIISPRDILFFYLFVEIRRIFVRFYG